MNREVHVRFDGSGKGKLLPATLRVPRIRKEVTACERRNRQSNAVQEMEEGVDILLPGPPGSALRERDSKPLQGASVKSGGLGVL